MGVVFSLEELQQYSVLTRRFARRWCEGADADDASQEVLLRLIRQQDQPRDTIAWCYVVTRRVCNEMRLRAATRRSAEDRYGRAIAHDVTNELTIDVASILQRLSPRERFLLELVREGIPTSEIAALLGCKTRDIGQLVKRARRKARILFDQKKSERLS
ncbi:MAG TPA: sigma-70 family RNA polymerase sigma factor [Thermoanaerobaculia bacterium]|nr:sigma-70 family RNA polymerase sigma factor [Thermoanaerobaculia bacterium]